MHNIYNELPKTAVQIKNSKDYIDIDGSVYTYITNRGINSGKIIRKSLHKSNGYLYCGIYYNDIKKNVSKRVHRLVAEAFIPNINNYPIVGHKNNIKSDNRVENLYWTTNSENIQKAVNDGLIINTKGYDDSQSIPVRMYETSTNKFIKEFESISEASKQLGISKSTISRQAKYHRPVRKPYYFRYIDDETASTNQIIAVFDYKSDRLLNTFYNSVFASIITGVNIKTIRAQCKHGKPKLRVKNYKYNNVYFGYLNSKCEQTIES